MSAFPDAVFQDLLKSLASVLEVAQNSSSSLNPKTKQAIYQATVDFRDGLSRAKELAENLPGGEMLIEEQVEVLAMLEKMRDIKRTQLEKFSAHQLSTIGPETQTKMEVDSTASSPHD